MYDVYFQFSNGTEYICNNVNKISVPSVDGFHDISGDEIMNYHYDINEDLYLYSDSEMFVISCKYLNSIEIRKN